MHFEPRKRPPRFGWNQKGTFGDFTIAKRYPALLKRLDGDMPTANLSFIANWLTNLQTTDLSGNLFEAITPFFKGCIARFEGQAYSNIPFLFIEFLFFNLINKYSGAFDHNIDPFHAEKIASVQAAVSSKIEFLRENSLADPRTRLVPLLRAATFGNIADLSQMSPIGSSQNIETLMDHTDRSAQRIASAPSHLRSQINIISDNCGKELIADLLLADCLIGDYSCDVCFFLKPWPMFVSDATRSDFFLHLERMSQSFESSVRALARRLQSSVDVGRLVVRDDFDWGEPRDFVELSLPLKQILDESLLTISKGDLNYRRYFQDRRWRSDTPLEKASVGICHPALLLRVVKSEIILGFESNDRFEIDQKSIVSGRLALAQTLNH